MMSIERLASCLRIKQRELEFCPQPQPQPQPSNASRDPPLVLTPHRQKEQGKARASKRRLKPTSSFSHNSGITAHVLLTFPSLLPLVYSLSVGLSAGRNENFTLINCLLVVWFIHSFVPLHSFNHTITQSHNHTITQSHNHTITHHIYPPARIRITSSYAFDTLERIPA
ncbi:uncharacterized protein LY89DRAFT_64100 [Mollisia scopiformis]|uniref:Uncharacterized protein n=1 Tax=Mollisia scopiformis TaxID=149040 RepID=A0A194XAK0_MOLSC|nr:uncharacterized protein LY89DRAFT_64100 [Mollisia scopiformis]KUJ16787.1 hypothetical protein LY89DRAFT_64100 [Mollisia scopiformis]